MRLALGIDPGSRFTGYGLVSREGSRLKYVAAGRISTKPKAPLPERLLQVADGLREVIGRYSPDEAAVEDIFYAKNVRSAIRLGHVRGVALCAAASAGLPVYEYPPAEIKLAVAGYGQAEKSQVCLMVRSILGIKDELAEDASDALAAAICHLNKTSLLKVNK